MATIKRNKQEYLKSLVKLFRESVRFNGPNVSL